MKVCEQHLAAAQERDLSRLRLLHFDDQRRVCENLGGRRRNRRAGTAIGLVVEAVSRAGTAFDDDRLSVMDKLADTARYQADAVFVRLDLFRHADQHRHPCSDSVNRR